MTIEEIAKLARDDLAPPEWLAKLARCRVVCVGSVARPDDAMTLEGPIGVAAREMAHSVGVLTDRFVSMGGWSHNPAAVGICCKVTE